jgi:hypothetical protein
MQSEIVELREALSDLKEEVLVLQEEVARLRRLVSRGASSSVNASVVNSPALHTTSAPSASNTPEPAVSRGPEGRSNQTREIQPWAEREAIAREVGAFLAKALRGDHRGNSGRERNNLASRFWIVCRGIDGETYNPPKIFRTWRAACALVKRGSAVGDSVFVGLPSQAECSVAISAAGLSYVGQIDD